MKEDVRGPSMPTSQRLGLLVSTFAVLALVPARASGNNSAIPTVAEQRLLQAIQAGKLADLSKLPDGQRTISADFLKHLMFETDESQVPGKLVHIKGAIIDFFSAEDNRGLSKRVPFELVFDSCRFTSFLCKDCKFLRDLHFFYSTFGGGGSMQGQLVLENAQIEGNLEIRSQNNLLVSLNFARISGTSNLWLPASSSLLATRLKSQAVYVEASAPANLNLPDAIADSMNLRIVGDKDSGIDIPGAVVDTISIDSSGPVTVNAARLTAKTASFCCSPLESASNDSKLIVATSLILDRSKIERDLFVEIHTTSISVQGVTVKERATFDADPTLSDLSFSTFDVLNWKYYPKSSTNLNGISFRTLNVSSDPGSQPSVRDALNFLRRAKSQISALTAYQTQLKTEGDNADAEKAYIAMRETLRDLEWEHWYTWPLGIVDLFQQYGLGFGHSPVPPFLWSLAFFIFGAFAFHNEIHMQPRVDKPSDFSGAWYSLELFLPIVDLGVAKEWRPKSESKWRVAYARAHQMAGWVLIPATLAAITGVVK
jgi:hypothetical protein